MSSTRARETVEISFAANRRVYGNWQSSIPSLSEIPSEIEQFDEMGLSVTFSVEQFNQRLGARTTS